MHGEVGNRKWSRSICIWLIYILLGVVSMNYLSDFLEVFLKVIEISLALAAWGVLKKKKKDE